MKICKVDFGFFPSWGTRYGRVRVIMRLDPETKWLPRILVVPLGAHVTSPFPPSRRDRPLQQPSAQFGPGAGHSIVLPGASFQHARFHSVGPVRIDHQLGTN